MKHLLNNMTEQEKNAIREQHTGGIKIMTENFSKLLNSKLGDSKPFVNESEAQMINTINNELSSVGEEPVSPEDIEFALNDCPLETPPNVDQKHETILQQVKGEIDKLTSVSDVKNLIKKIKSIFKRKTQNEQAEVITIGAMAIPVVLIQVLAGIIIVMLVVKLIKLILNSDTTRVNPECRRASRRMRNYWNGDN
jgi:hypothetical protein